MWPLLTLKINTSWNGLDVVAPGQRIHEIILGMSTDHIGDLYGDSTGFGLLKYKSWSHAKYGEISCHDYAKLRVIAAVGGKILTFEVTPGTTGDSPQLKGMLEHTYGNGHSGPRSSVRRMKTAKV